MGTTAEGSTHKILGEVYGYPLKFDFYMENIRVPLEKDRRNGADVAYVNSLVTNPFKSLYFGKMFQEDEFQQTVACPRDSYVLGTHWINCRKVALTGENNISQLGIQTSFFGNRSNQVHLSNPSHPWWMPDPNTKNDTVGGVNLESYAGKTIPPNRWAGFMSQPLDELDVFLDEFGLPFRLSLDKVFTLRYDKGDRALGTVANYDNVEIDLHQYCLTPGTATKLKSDQLPQQGWDFTMDSIRNSSKLWPQGMFYISKTWRDELPFYRSMPHFMYNQEWGGQEFNNFGGFRPDKDRHRTCFYFDPITGEAMQYSRRFQLNYALDQSVLFPTLYQQRLHFPVVWTERGKVITPEDALNFQATVLVSYGVMLLLTGLGIGFGMLATLAGCGMMMAGTIERRARIAKIKGIKYKTVRKTPGAQ